MTAILSSATASAADAAHAAASSILAAAQITPGTPIPATPVKENDPDQMITFRYLFGRNIILGVPGAFTRPCSGQILEYIYSFKDFQDKNVHGIHVVSVNDVFVMKAWKDSLAREGTPVHFYADDRGAFSSALGLIFDATPRLGSPRAKRYALVVDDDKVSAVYVDNDPDEITATAAESLLKTL
ncbi:Redoxin [Hysterangium stoloniferum]|nr:Redoxin [Hysterangium stoloniferum]